MRQHRSRLTPIPTVFRGYRFRSRLEARWAVFFHTLNLRWVYEPEAFRSGPGAYLPDFLVGTRSWVEVKPDRSLTVAEVGKAVRFAADLGDAGSVFIFKGQPWPREYAVAMVRGDQVMETNLEWCHCPLCDSVGLNFVTSSWRGQAMNCQKCRENPPRSAARDMEDGKVLAYGPGITESDKLLAAYQAARGERFGT